MASKVLVVSVMTLFSIAVVRAIPKYWLQSENQDDVNCTGFTYQSTRIRNFCRPYPDIIDLVYLTKRYPNANEDFYRSLSQRLTAFCASQCKRIIVAFYKYCNMTHVVTVYNYGVCGKINQEFCLVRHLRGTAAGIIVTLDTLRSICPLYANTDNIYYCVEGACQRNVIQWANYMECCASSFLRALFNNLTSCGITNTTLCRPSGTVTISSSVFIMIAIAIILMYWM